MKNCPQCSTAYDEATMFCLNDGTPLIHTAATASSDEPPPTVWSGSAPPVFQSPQTSPLKSSLPVMPAASFSPNANPVPRKSRTGRIILYLAIGLGGVFIVTVGFAVLGFYILYNTRSNYVAGNNYNTARPANNFNKGSNSVNSSVSSSNSSSSKSVTEPILYESRNGFIRGQPYVKTTPDYPGALKTNAAIYSLTGGAGAKVIHGESSIYGSKEDASDGFENHLKALAGRNAKILSRGNIKDTIYVYYQLDQFYGICVGAGVSVVDYSSDKMVDLQSFLK